MTHAEIGSGPDADEDIRALLKQMSGRLDRIEAKLEPLQSVAEQADRVVGTLVDTVDDRMARLSDLDERLAQTAALATRLSDPSLLALLNKAADVALDLEPLAATTADVVDEAMRNVPRVDDRIAALKALIVQATEPDTLRQLELGLQLMSTWPQVVGTVTDTLDGWVAKSPDLLSRLQNGAAALETLTRPEVIAALTEAAEMSASATQHVATGVDALDALFARLKDEGVQVDTLIGNGMRLVPAILAILQDPAVPRLFESEMLGTALRSTEKVLSALPQTEAKPIGVFGLLSLLKEPGVQMSLNAGLAFAREMNAGLQGPTAALAPKS